MLLLLMIACCMPGVPVSSLLLCLAYLSAPLGAKAYGREWHVVRVCLIIEIQKKQLCRLHITCTRIVRGLGQASQTHCWGQFVACCVLHICFLNILLMLQFILYTFSMISN